LEARCKQFLWVKGMESVVEERRGRNALPEGTERTRLTLLQPRQFREGLRGTKDHGGGGGKDCRRKRRKNEGQSHPLARSVPSGGGGTSLELRGEDDQKGRTWQWTKSTRAH